VFSMKKKLTLLDSEAKNICKSSIIVIAQLLTYTNDYELIQYKNVKIYSIKMLQLSRQSSVVCLLISGQPGGLGRSEGSKEP
jgi:hypothetical protein